MATAKTITDLKIILKTPRIGMIEVMQQINAKNESRYFVVVEDDRYPISKNLFEELSILAERTDTIHTTNFRGCRNQYKTLMLNH